MTWVVPFSMASDVTQGPSFGTFIIEEYAASPTPDSACAAGMLDLTMFSKSARVGAGVRVTISPPLLDVKMQTPPS